jgi:hypothetical protein
MEEPVEETPPAPPLPDDEEEAAPPPPGRSRRPLIAGAVAVLIAAAVAAFLFLPLEDVSDEDVAIVPAPTPVPPAADPCGPEMVATLAGLDFAGARAALAGCGGVVSPDEALAVLERGAASGEAGALLAFAQAYDGEVQGEVFEAELGVAFGDDPALAAEYYARAATAGSDAARAPLGAVCVRLADMTATTARAAFQEYCP